MATKPNPTHSRIGASTCERWWNCPGSVRAVAAIPPQTESPYAAEGTAAHELGEICLHDGKDACEHVGEFSKSGIEFTDEMAEAVQMYLDTIRFDMATYDLTKEDIKIEHRFHLTHVDEAAFGTNDCNLPVFLDKVIVYDYKHGKGVAVDAEENKQLMYYALGAAALGDYETVEVVIVQPRAVHRDGPIRRWTLSIAELDSFAEQLKVKIEATRAHNANLVVGEWCKKTFCPAMATCPAVRGRVQRDAMVVFDKPVVSLPAPETITVLEMRRLLEGMPLIEQWLKSVWAYAEQRANNGEEVLGFKLVRGREGNRKWVNPEDTLALFEAGLTEDDMYEQNLKSPAVLEKISKEAKAAIKNLTTRSEGKIILVPEDDPREAVQPNATDVFSLIE